SAVALLSSSAAAQSRGTPGRSIGTVAVQGNLIVMTLDSGVLGAPNLFDLAHRTLRFIPEKTGYRIENLPERWDAEFGAPLTANRAAIAGFAFPFSGKAWSSFSVGMTGSLTFDDAAPATGRGGAGLSVARFAELQEAASGFVGAV